MATCVARTCDFTAAEMKIPSPRAPMRKNSVITERRRTLPFRGVPKIRIPAVTVTATSNAPMAR